MLSWLLQQWHHRPLLNATLESLIRDIRVCDFAPQRLIRLQRLLKKTRLLMPVPHAGIVENAPLMVADDEEGTTGLIAFTSKEELLRWRSVGCKCMTASATTVFEYALQGGLTAVMLNPNGNHITLLRPLMEAVMTGATLRVTPPPDLKLTGPPIGINSDFLTSLRATLRQHRDVKSAYAAAGLDGTQPVICIVVIMEWHADVLEYDEIYKKLPGQSSIGPALYAFADEAHQTSWHLNLQDIGSPVYLRDAP